MAATNTTTSIIHLALGGGGHYLLSQSAPNLIQNCKEFFFPYRVVATQRSGRLNDSIRLYEFLKYGNLELKSFVTSGAAPHIRWVKIELELLGGKLCDL